MEELIEEHSNNSRLIAIKNWMVGKIPILQKYVELSSQTGCCGMCPNCIGVVATGLAISLLPQKTHHEEQLEAVDYSVTDTLRQNAT